MMRDMAFGNKRHPSTELRSGGFMRTYKAAGVDLSELRRIQIESEALRKREIEERKMQREARRVSRREGPKYRAQRDNKNIRITEGSPGSSSGRAPVALLGRAEGKPADRGYFGGEPGEPDYTGAINNRTPSSPNTQPYPFSEESQQLLRMVERFTSPYHELVSEGDRNVFAEFLNGNYESSDKRVCIVLHSGGIKGKDGDKREDTFIELDYKNNMWKRVTKLFPME